MRSADPKLIAALASGERTPSHTTRLGGAVLGGELAGGRLQSWSVERSYNTDLPAAMRAFSGSSAAQLELDISGTEEDSAPRLYSPWAPRRQGDVVRPGQTVVHAAGLDGRDLPVFRGTVRSRSAASGGDTVHITALDGAERLRGPAQFNNPYSGFGWKRPIASEVWCVDELLRQGGLASCQPPRAPEADALDANGQGDASMFTVLYASLHGGVNSTFGQPETVPDPNQYTYVREGAPYTMALRPKARQLSMAWVPRSRLLTPSADRWLVEGHVNSGSGPGDVVELRLRLDRRGAGWGYLSFKVDFSTGQVFIESGTEGSTGWYFLWRWDVLARLKGAWHLGLLVTPATTAGGTMPTIQPMFVGPDGVRLLGSSNTYVDPSAAQPDAELSSVQLITDMATEAVQITTRIPASFTFSDFATHGVITRSVELDDPVLPLLTLPRVSGSQWEAISEIARVSMSTAEFDEYGVFRWRNYLRLSKPPAAPDLTVTSLREIAALTVSEEMDACRNYCEQPYQNWMGLGYDYGEDFSPDGVLQIPPGRSVDVPYPVPDEGFEVGPPVPYDDAAPLTGGSRVRFGDAYVKDVSGGVAVKGAVLVSVRRVATNMVLRFTNRGAKTLWTTTKDGKPSIIVSPLKANGTPAQYSRASWNTDSQKYYGLQQYAATGAEWVQDGATAQKLANTLRDVGSFPVPTLSEVEVLYDPRVQLGDVVRVLDSTGAELDTLAYVIGIRTSAVAGTPVQQTLTLRGTSYNGTPYDLWLAADPPTDPDASRLRTYAEIKSAHAALSELTGTSYRALKEYL
ncbi:hypothetical protein [Streptomyces sp. H39-S7]|uniref:hypothetical protein n=1 Tax=Streptomyces sp. H39-S7 TaxID=3004357 RepID=UPI0022AE61AE|nr:hypothetical protein [Streptomyces sp. H39-S7]MCZ4117886.1 hypothetical protein [Streptomyces sp. H39-S7]